MQVSRLEVFGFKSFMERLVLPLEGGITGVVGPNGCGKSNIVDALRWVLGETRAKSLRGGVLEDVIFNGTESLRPLGLAEVSITLRSSSENFFEDLNPADFEAQLISEEVTEVSNEEDLLIEENNLAQSDQEQVPQLTVIEGNLGKTKIDQVEEELLDASNNETSLDIEESSKSLKTNNVSALLSQHFSWLKGVNEVQVTRRLYRSGESEFFINRVPCRLKDLKELFRAVGLGPRSYTIVAQGEVGRIITSKPEERRSILEEAAGVQGFRDKISASNRRLEETDINISRLVDIIKEVDRQVNSLKRQASKAKNRQALKDEISEIEQRIYCDAILRLQEHSKIVEATLAEQNDLEGQLQSKLQSAKAIEEEQRNDLMSIDLAGDNLRAKIDTIREELNNRVRQRSDKKAQLSELEAFKQSRESEVVKLKERLTELDNRSQQAKDKIAQLSKEEQELGQQIADLDLSASTKFNQLTIEKESLRKKIQVIDQELRHARENLISRQSSLSSIEEQLIIASPLTQLEKTLEHESFATIRELTEKAKLLVDELKVPDKYTKAVQAVLNERAGFLVTSEPHAVARNFISATANISERSGLGLGVVKSELEFSEEVAQASHTFPSLASLITSSDNVKGAVYHFLQNVCLVNQAEEAFSYFKNQPDDKTSILVTLSGEIVTANSFYCLQHEAGLVQLKQKADQLRVEIANFEGTSQFASEQLSLESAKLTSIETEASELLALVQERQSEASELSAKLGSVRGRLQSENNLVQQMLKDSENISNQITESDRMIANFIAQIDQVQTEIEVMNSSDEASLQEQVKALQTEYSALDQVRTKGREKLAELANQSAESRKALDQSRSLQSSALLDQQKISLELNHIKERLTEEYSSEHYDLLLQNIHSAVPLNETERDELKDRVQKLKSRIVREGEVDPTSIENLEVESARLTELESQRDDLEAAAKTLKRTIEKLTETSILRFTSTFSAVQKNFSMLIPRLFGGGKGSIELTDPNNPLESGIEIVVRPPGKKLKSIELLSGGEKALCAIGLVFAMFMVKPSPLCILDEVDAPLDEANLLRFVNMVKEMSRTTQFIMITHNKGSMTASDRLVGVTMPEPGASRIISVSLQEAYQQVA